MKNNRHVSSRDPPHSLPHPAAERHPRVLVVEDDPILRQLNMEVLTRAGYDVASAEEGSAAWQALNAGSYDLMITDNNMQGVSGLELVRKVRDAHMKLPVIMATGTFPQEAVARNSSLRLAAKLHKPYTADELLRVVEEVLHLAEAQESPMKPYPLIHN